MIAVYLVLFVGCCYKLLTYNNLYNLYCVIYYSPVNFLFTLVDEKKLEVSFVKSSQSFVSTRDIPTASITKHAFWNAAPSIGAILMIVGETGRHKSGVPLLIGRFCLSLFIETNKFRMTSLSLLNTLTTNKSHWHGRDQAATWQPPLPPLFCRQIHHKSTIANHTTVQQRQPNILATTQHHTTLTSPDTNYDVWFVIAFVWITCWGLASTSAIATLRWTAGKGQCA